MKQIVVCSEKCNQCLFTKDKIVSDERKKELLNNTRGDNHFLCHKGTLKGKKVICKGSWDSKLKTGEGPYQILDRLKLVTFIKPEEI